MTVKIYRPDARDYELGIGIHPEFCQADIGQTIGWQCPRLHIKYPEDWEGFKFCKDHERERRKGG